MVNIKENLNLTNLGKQKKKKQIILTHTSRNINDYISSLKFRHNGKFDKIPHYIIGKEGSIYRALSDTAYSNFFKNINVNRNSIIISLENLGWLEKRPLTDYYVNWISDIYKGDIYERKWRDYFFWEPYPEKQIEACAELCNSLIKEFSIDKKCIGHNTKVDGIERYEGVVTRSNFNSDYTDLSPSFNFETFLKHFENE